ncbi:MAG: hypothetical protein ACREKL_04625 [Chthoniobacterales bacterium]
MFQISDAHEAPSWLKTKIADLVWRITPNCREVARLTSEGRDRTLPPGVRLRLGLHRLACKWCARYAGQLDLLHQASRRLPAQLETTGEPALSIETKSRLKEALRRRQDGRF